jgi:endonuclease/exonuclease/phosphatase family metal-dependent hydrolase
MRSTSFFRVLALAATLTACSSDLPTAANVAYYASRDVEESNAGGNKYLTVMTRNVYFGASLEPVMSAPVPQLIPIRVAQVWGQVQQTNFPERAKALADEIAANDPELIGLQEVGLWRTQFPGDAHTATGAPATEVVYDFLQILLDELEARGEKYVVAAVVENIDAELFMFTGVPGASLTRDIRLTDRDVILARHSLTISNAQAAQYDTKAVLPVGGPNGPRIVIPRGWTSVDAKFHGEEFRFFNTHLEVESFPFTAVQIAQGLEAIAILDQSPLPVIAVGDYNSAADGSTTPTYASLLASGLTDVWAATNPEESGMTGGMSNDLLGPVSLFRMRIDLVLFRGPMTATAAWLVGNEESDRTPSGLMPSDHAGVVAKVRLGVPD